VWKLNGRKRRIAKHAIRLVLGSSGVREQKRDMGQRLELGYHIESENTALVMGNRRRFRTGIPYIDKIWESRGEKGKTWSQIGI